MFPTTHPSFDLIICDIDGCLSPESSTPFDLTNLTKIAEHNRLAVTRKDRPILTLCSGRPQPFAEAMCRLLSNVHVPCVCENGVWLYHPGTNIYETDPAITREHLTAVREAGDWLRDTFGHGSPAAHRHGPVTQQPGKIASVSLYHPRPEHLREISAQIEAHFNEHRWPLRVSMTWFYINCDLRHISKATGVERLFAQTGIDPSRTLGIGDTPSDLAFAAKVKTFACPANAHADVKPKADYISPYEEAAGVVDILEKLAAPSTR